MKNFIDGPHPIAKEYHILIARFTGKNAPFILPKLKALILKDPTYLRPYQALVDILDEMGQSREAQSILDQAWQQLSKNILIKGTQWPDRIDWYNKSNRHILLAILQKGIFDWKQGKNSDAMDLFRKLMHINPTDEVGARQFLLACLMGYSFEKFETEFDKDGYLDDKIDSWFLDQSKMFSTEFQWWIDGKYLTEDKDDDSEEDYY